MTEIIIDFKEISKLAGFWEDGDVFIPPEQWVMDRISDVVDDYINELVKDTLAGEYVTATLVGNGPLFIFLLIGTIINDNFIINKLIYEPSYEPQSNLKITIFDRTISSSVVEIEKMSNKNTTEYVAVNTLDDYVEPVLDSIETFSEKKFTYNNVSNGTRIVFKVENELLIAEIFSGVGYSNMTSVIKRFNNFGCFRQWHKANISTKYKNEIINKWRKIKDKGINENLAIATKLREIINSIDNITHELQGLKCSITRTKITLELND